MKIYFTYELRHQYLSPFGENLRGCTASDKLIRNVQKSIPWNSCWHRIKTLITKFSKGKCGVEKPFARWNIRFFGAGTRLWSFEIIITNCELVPDNARENVMLFLYFWISACLSSQLFKKSEKRQLLRKEWIIFATGVNMRSNITKKSIPGTRMAEWGMPSLYIIYI